ncbi:NB-ARC domain-containing protein [Saccharopolyspora sp. NPDC002686]|uniref:NB-ARC domain-containing protein n=1 Tax=Saccharopolyspora sp. NPDC002686 TaxID=3154541 RepID=UPI00331C14E5
MESSTEGTRNTASSAENIVQAQNVLGDIYIQGSADSVVSPRMVPRQLPAAVRNFINRTVEQDALTTLLNGRDSTVLVSTVDGIAGVGKSTLVVQWAHRIREQFPDGELYVNLRGFDPVTEPMAPTEALAGFLAALGVAPEAVAAAEETRAAQFRTLAHGRRMLLVLDNARDAEQVLPLLPGSPGCLVVVTSRQRLDELVAHHGAQRLTLVTLTHDEGRRLLAGFLGDERLANSPDAVAALLEHCAGLPLALTLVAAQAALEPDVALEELASDLSDERERLDVLDLGGRTGIRAVFSWSYRALSPQAARLFRLLGLPDSPDISAEAAAALAGADQRQTRRALAELCRAHLLTRRTADRYVFHDLLRAYARERVHRDDTEEERSAALQRLFGHYLRMTYAANRRLAPLRVLPEIADAKARLAREFTTYEEALAWWDAEHTSVLAAIRQSVTLGMSEGPWLAHAAAYPFKLRGSIDELKVSSNEGLRGALGSGNRVAQARLLGDLATAHYFHREFNTANKFAQSAVELFAELGEHNREAAMHIQVGESFLELERYADAADSARHALRIRGISDDQVALDGVAEAVLGLAEAHLGDFTAGLAHLRQALEISSDQFLRGFALLRIGSVHLLAGQTDEAVRSYQLAVEHCRTIGYELGEADSFTKLGEALHAGGDVSGARQAWQSALVLLDRLGHTDGDVVRHRLNELDAADSDEA